MKIYAGSPSGPEELVTIRITRKVRSKTYGRGGYYLVESYQELMLMDTTLNEVFDVVAKSIEEKVRRGITVNELGLICRGAYNSGSEEEQMKILLLNGKTIDLSADVECTEIGRCGWKRLSSHGPICRVPNAGCPKGIEVKQRCRVCGCTEHYACRTPEGACHWVKDNLCSACAQK